MLDTALPTEQLYTSLNATCSGKTHYFFKGFINESEIRTLVHVLLTYNESFYTIHVNLGCLTSFLCIGKQFWTEISLSLKNA